MVCERQISIVGIKGKLVPRTLHSFGHENQINSPMTATEKIRREKTMISKDF